ncbi:MAG TPA: hypothetical protein DEF43_19750 [Chloroflexus aurantiacus]|jgi:hypothetical protein|uniref:Uncharacterized protein n=1 Tax=Chloroflexus aurantiacus (strain ATCC 29366 / DSM 635 / J-10-fl) TaxID=324602 RepID=A9WEP4_CHLAA|nr:MULTISPECIES: hypothetical protein [Chloroflexus]RMG46653.1 MAG: hypothetical protein D6716_17375 [Chloroflexota bacterium]GIV64504.1 MAG: hypothetical protein KatS3mg045_1843 [Bellilinea sp.]ABY33803.1 hypothetical protein Caur_0557 [Chloroflexus aurantiacus J-10-fl]GIV64608.1 MAG: hypothetical protein KatS3mg045_1947 [Bellilinea sp.]GIV64643.1 MAG: hypothetical protein KatS3mg045_1982 [Bellilinea sp.]
MNALLICNVGGRDVLHPALPKNGHSERQWAQTALERYPELCGTFSLPIISKALHYLATRRVVIDHVILIASDQPPPPVGNAKFWSSDTIYSAQIIAHLLCDGLTPYPRLDGQQITIWTIQTEDGQGCDPSDYDLTLRFLERRLAELRRVYPHHTAFFEVTGGTPAMTTGLLIAGTEIFGSQTEILSVHPNQELPIALNTGKRLLATPLRASLRSHAASYAYAAAARTFLEHEAIITDRLEPTAARLIAPLLAYAHHRFNFDFASARSALQRVRNAGPWRAELDSLLAQVNQPVRQFLLAEVVRGAAARYQIGLYADFLTQVVRFEENLLRYLCLQQGAWFCNRQRQLDPDGTYLAREWLSQQTFTLSRDRDPNRDLIADRSVMRELLGNLLGRAQPGQHNLLTAIDRLGELVKRRNELTHHLEGVQKAGLARAFAGPQASPSAADQIVPHLEQLYEQVCHQPLPPSPYQHINRLLDRLLQATQT